MAATVRKRPLRSVAPDEKPPPRKRIPRKPKTILQAAESGSRLDELKAMRRRIASACDNPSTPARDLSSLMRRQLEIGKEIESIELRAKQEGEDAANSPGDEEWDPETL